MHNVKLEEHQPDLRQLPRPHVTKMRWPFPMIWLVPLCAMAIAGGYVYLHYQEHGAEITIRFDDADGLRIGQTPVNSHGVAIGKVIGLELTSDHRHVWVHVATERKYASIASEGALFWIVRPDFSDGMISGLGTVVSGPYIEVEPGVGERKSEFIGLERQPPSLGYGLIIILHADRLEHLQPDSPIYYRGIQVGVVEGAHLARDATHVDINAVIRERFVRLVTPRSEFWKLNGLDVKGGIFTGVNLKLDSLRTLLTGGIEFATPDDHANEPAADGADYTLHDEPKKEWLVWAPKIPLPPQALLDSQAPQPSTESSRLGAAVGKKQQGN
jgi:paraquat-inducible protein B